MAPEWQSRTIGEICDAGGGEIQTGPFGSQLHADDYVDTGVPVVPTEAIRDRRIDWSCLPRIRPHKAEYLRRHWLRAGDILFARRGVQATGRIALVRQQEHGLVCGTGAMRLRLDPGRSDVIPEFLSHVLANPGSIAWFKFHAIGATMPNLNEGIVRAFPVPVPPISEQHAIAHILGTLDDKIELNRRMSATLEAMTQALFKSWFVDFDPVRAKVEGRDTGLPREIGDLFPDRFEGSEIGPIPAGWSTCGLDDIADFLNGLALQRYPPNSGPSLPVVKIAQLRRDDTTGADRCSADVPITYRVDDGDVLFSWSGSLDCVFWTGGTGALNQHVFKVTSTRVPKWFYYFWIQHHLPRFRHIAAGKATTMGHIQRGHLAEAKVVLPSPRAVERAHASLAPLVAQLLRQRGERRTLAALRDALLPKLVSGELRVRDAERFVSEAGV